MARLSACVLALMLQGLHLYGGDPQYVGSKVCFACHSDIYRSFMKTDMGRSMRLASDFKAAGVPESASVLAPDGKRVFQVAHNETGWTQTEAEDGIFRNEQQLAYVVGSGANGLTFFGAPGKLPFPGASLFLFEGREVGSLTRFRRSRSRLQPAHRSAVCFVSQWETTAGGESRWGVFGSSLSRDCHWL